MLKVPFEGFFRILKFSQILKFCACSKSYEVNHCLPFKGFLKTTNLEQSVFKLDIIDLTRLFVIIQR